MKRPWCARQG
ncbi:hypothetical protein Taro_010727 [Colocasia esculenta]|uniref:Uncharacterized protein n=1 Tax=Colocasia esculenta TaxID=4460 RepID=A0A843UAG0_COLES|nr:hypothetical protein [Colocasia esculenta]